MPSHELKPAPKPLVRASGGTPAGFADFVPLNPWGRPMPKPVRPPRPMLYQVVVRDKARGNREVRVGPQWPRELAEMLCLTIANQIRLGAERRWSEPVIIAMPATLGTPSFIGV